MSNTNSKANSKFGQQMKNNTNRDFLDKQNSIGTRFNQIERKVQELQENIESRIEIEEEENSKLVKTATGLEMENTTMKLELQEMSGVLTGVKTRVLQMSNTHENTIFTYLV